MKLSSISLIAVAFAAIAGSVTAAPTPHPFEHVDIYSRADIHHAIAVNLEAASRAGGTKVPKSMRIGVSNICKATHMIQNILNDR